jgi:hypothetical protein
MTMVLPRCLGFGGLWLAASLMLCACGKVGTLEQPAPLYGAKAKADYQAKKAAAAAAAKAGKDDGEPEPLAPDTPGLDPPNSGRATLRDQPAPGMRSLPNAPAPAGGLPDPYTRPQ